MFRGGFPRPVHRPSRCLLDFGISGLPRSRIRGRRYSRLWRHAPLLVLPPQPKHCHLQPSHHLRHRHRMHRLQVGNRLSELLRDLDKLLGT